MQSIDIAYPKTKIIQIRFAGGAKVFFSTYSPSLLAKLAGSIFVHPQIALMFKNA